MSSKIIPREIIGKPSTARVDLRYKELISKEAYIDSERAQLYTDYIKAHWNEPMVVRAGGALKYVLSNLTPKIWEDELLVGSQSRYFLGTQVYPEYETWMLEGCQTCRFIRIMIRKGNQSFQCKNRPFIEIIAVKILFVL